MQNKTLPVVYHEGYNITLAGLQRLHPFDSEKYGRVVGFLEQRGVLRRSELVRPAPPSAELLRAALDPDYLRGLDDKANIARYTEIGLVSWLPLALVRARILRPMLLATGGTLEATRLARERGWALNLGGGYHHASFSSGGGFCIYPDISLAVREALGRTPPLQRVMIVDLDAHQGNGHERDHGDDPRVFIVDIYNHAIFPGDDKAKTGIDVDLNAPNGITTEAYLAAVEKALDRAFANFQPQLVIYNAGTDIIKGDPLGAMAVTEQGVIKRDEMVFRRAFKAKAAIVMLLSGGYQKTNAQTIAHSIENLFKTFNLRGRGATTHRPGSAAR